MNAYQIEKYSTEEFGCLAALKVACYQTAQVQTEDDNTDLAISRIKL